MKGNKFKKCFKNLTKKKKIILCTSTCIVAVLIIGGVIFFTKSSQGAMSNRTMPTSTAEVSKGDISTTVVGTGTLATDSANDVVIPIGLTIEKVCVETGDTVKEGDVLATVNEASIKNAISDIQDSISSLDTQIKALDTDTTTETIKTSIAGRVKKIFTETSAKVSDAMIEHGALLLLSLDGKMAVNIETSSDLSVGDTVQVALSDDTTIEGTVDSLNNETCVITVTDDGPAYDDSVTVLDSNGNTLGSGNLYIHKQMTITGTSGTISKIYVTENESVSASTKLFYVKDVESTSEYDKLVTQREELTATLQNMLTIAQTNTITSTYSGCIATISVSDNTVVEKSSSTSSGNTTSTSSGTSSGSGNGFTSMSTSANTTKTAALISLSTTSNKAVQSSNTVSETNQLSEDSGNSETPTEPDEPTQPTQLYGTLTFGVTAPVTGATPQKDLVVDESTNHFTASISWSPASDKFAASTAYTATLYLKASDGYAFSNNKDNLNITVDSLSKVPFEIKDLDNDGNMETIIITLAYPATAADKTTNPDSNNTENNNSSSNNSSNSNSSNSNTSNSNTSNNSTTSNNANSNNTTTQAPTNNTGSGTSSGTSGGSGVSISGGGSGSNGSGSSSSSSGSSTNNSSNSSSSSSDLYSSNETVGFTVTTNENMLLSVNVDELDILSIQKGQEVTITLDALEEENFQGTITNIATTATNSGGVSKYAVEVTLSKTDSMLSGMNASATITIEKKEDVLSIPVDALQEQGNRVFVYTSSDSDTGSLGDEVEVETGLSDGTNVEITSGLSEGDTVYYIQVQTSSSSSEETMMGGKGMMGGSNMGGMSAPSADFGGNKRDRASQSSGQGAPSMPGQ